MKQTYSHILTFWFKHRYFSDELFKSVDISLAESSQKTINDLGIIIKPFPGGFNLLAANPELLNSLDDSSPLQLYIYCQDPLYINYTELPSYSLRDTILYFNNLSAGSNPNESFTLHQSKFLSKDDVIQLSSGQINIPDYNPQNKYHFTDASGKEISSVYVVQTPGNTGSFFISGIEQSLVRAFSANDEILKAYYHPKALWKKPLAVLELFAGKLSEQNKTNGKVDYRICFDNRKTTWKYFMVSPVYQKFNNLSIINKAKEQVFLPPQKQLVHQNTSALVFESKIKIPLAEFSDENFQLVDNFDPTNRSGKIILKSLAKASSEQLFSDQSKPVENVYSHIYI
ncbi:MAG: hypothetical protein JZU47_09235 [Prolixibacteraceae bacterium]|nr:hypothetical protein [Prolixibacteraceae bacterium]